MFPQTALCTCGWTLSTSVAPSIHLILGVCAEVGKMPLDRFEKPQGGLMKGPPQQVLLDTQHNGGIATGRSSIKVLPAGRRVKGRGWMLVGRGVGRVLQPAVCGHGFSVAVNKAVLFMAIQRCKLLFIKVSHSACSKQNRNSGYLERTVGNTPILCPLSLCVTGSS